MPRACWATPGHTAVAFPLVSLIEVVVVVVAVAAAVVVVVPLAAGIAVAAIPAVDAENIAKISLYKSLISDTKFDN